MKKVIPALMMALALLSTLIFTQCTPKEPQKRPETKEEILQEIEKNYILYRETAEEKVYIRYIKTFEVAADRYIVRKDSEQVYGENNLSPEKVQEIEQFMEKHPEIWNKMPKFPETIQNNLGETCRFYRLTSENHWISLKEETPGLFRAVHIDYVNDSGKRYPLSIVMNLRDGTEKHTVDEYRDSGEQEPAENP